MKDRVPLYPGRVKLTPVAGQANTYDMSRADSPQQEGTPLNKASLLTDATAEAIGLSGDPTVNDALFVLSQTIPTAEVRVYGDTGTTVTITRGGKTLTGTVASIGYATLYPTELGDWTIVFTYNGAQKTKVYTLEVIGIVSVYPFVVGSTLEATSWDNIAAVSKFGQAPNYWKVGDKKNITVNGVTYAAQIIGFDHDTLTTVDGSRTKAGITFQLVDCLNTTYSMNGSNTNVNGWRGSTMRTSTMATLLNQLSSDLKSVLKFVNKVTSKGDNQSGLETTSDKLFLLSEIEVFGATQYSYAGEGKQYEYYTAGNSAIKKVNGSADTWWGRSPRSGNTAAFCSVDVSGHADYNSATISSGVSFGFCV